MQSSQASLCQSLPVTWVLFGHKPQGMGMARIQEASGCTAGSSLAAMQEPCSYSYHRAGGMALTAAVPVRAKHEGAQCAGFAVSRHPKDLVKHCNPVILLLLVTKCTNA
ncbi:hypothetical protein EK904_006795 [Melospiza melodia maxima]|nr:hypothetical protein EK904_006795 [Melospiza melodia maxima]